MPTLFQPIWLLLLIPLAAAWFAWPLPHRGLRALRAAVFLFTVLALAGLAIKLPDRAGVIVVVADRSDSMPDKAAASEKEIITLLNKSAQPRDLLGVVAFGQHAVVERSPQRGEFAGFTAQVGSDHSSLNDAIETALGLIPSDAGGRILVLSDGKWTGKDPAAAAARAAGRGVAIDYRALARPQTRDVAVQSFLTPSSVLPGQAFVLSAWVQAPLEQEISYQLKRGEFIVSSGKKSIPAGLSRLMFRDRAGAAGVSDYTVSIEGSQDDPIPENNSARALVGVDGSRPALVVSSAGDESGLVKLLRAGGIEVVGKKPGACRWSLEELSQFSAVVLENVPANSIGTGGMETLASWVEETGSGLVLCGGQKSYGPGGYFKSPLERVLPISMEMRREHRKMSLAISVALDRSGSMAVSVGGGRKKIDLADLGTVQVLDLLSPMDEIGVLAVDTTAHEIVPMDTVEKNQAQRSRILGINSMGGGIYIYEALVAAAQQVSSAKAGTKHIILFADAADSEQSADYKTILEKCRESEVTVSVIGLGTENDVDANLLKDIALRGGGDCYFTANAEEIPRLFAQDTFTVARSTFVDQPTPFSFTPGWSLLGGALAGNPPTLGGYNLCYARPEANLAAVTGDEYKAPVVASWNAGNGRVLCFSGEADGKFSGDFAKWNQAGEFYATLARWAQGKRQPLPDEMLLTQEVRDGACFVQLHLDPARKADPFTTLPRVKMLHGIPGTAPAKETIALQWRNADLLEAVVPMGGRETVLNTVEISGQQPVTLPPVCLPYSPEFVPEQTGRGVSALAQIAATTGGVERGELPKIWDALPEKSRFVPLAPWLYIAATILFLLEVLERRTGWCSRALGKKKLSTPADTADEREEKVAAKTSASSRPSARSLSKPQSLPWLRKKSAPPQSAPVSAPPPVATPSTKPAPAASDDSQLDALRKARERASKRTDKK
jgi:Mg-chelatase subunit ChlD